MPFACLDNNRNLLHKLHKLKFQYRLCKMYQHHKIFNKDLLILQHTNNHLHNNLVSLHCHPKVSISPEELFIEWQKFHKCNRQDMVFSKTNSLHHLQFQRLLQQ